MKSKNPAEPIAKNDGTLLKEHSEAVASLCKTLCDNTLRNDEDEVEIRNIKESVRIAALIHDAGKSIPFFQDYISGKISEAEVEKRKKTILYHNDAIMLWLTEHRTQFVEFLGSRIEKTPASLSPNEYFTAIRLAVYYHHGNNITPSEAIKELENKRLLKHYDRKSITGFVSDILGYSFNDENLDTIMESDAPIIYVRGDSVYESVQFFVRATLISADESVSGAKETERIYATVDPKNLRCPGDWDKDRFNTQIDCASSLSDAASAIINAPAGMGKTAIGLASVIASSRHSYWVNPRNVVVESVFDSIKRDAESILGEYAKYLTIETVTGNERKNSWDFANSRPLNDDEEARLTITNIDYFCEPFVKGRNKIGQFYAFHSNVVFDEYHELFVDSAFFKLFQLTTYFRNWFCKESKTLFLSATPIKMNWLASAKYLPEKNKHYPAQHKKEYAVEFGAKPSSLDNETICVNQTVRETQMFRNGELVIHSYFSDSHRKEKMDRIVSAFGKHPDVSKRVGTASCQLLQASLDVSYPHLAYSVSVPWNTVQAVGRCNRWGELDDAKITFFDNENDKGAWSYCAPVKEIRRKWLDVVKTLPENMTLDELYGVYDNFMDENSGIVNEFVKMNLNESAENLLQYVPVRSVLRYQENVDEVKTSTVTVRSLERSRYIGVIDENSNELVVLSVEDSSTGFSNKFEETTGARNAIGWTDIRDWLSKWKCILPNNVYENLYSVFFKKNNVELTTTLKSKRFDCLRDRNRGNFFFCYRKDCPFPAIMSKYTKEYGLEWDR